MYPLIFGAIFITIVAILLLVVIIKKKRQNDSKDMKINTENKFDIYDDIDQVANEEYSEYNYNNYNKANEYDNNYEDPNDDRYVPREKALALDPYYLKLDETKYSGSHQNIGMASGLTQNI